MKSLQLKRGQQKYLNIKGSLKILRSSWKNIVLVTWVTLCSEQLLWTPWNKTLFNSWYDRFTKGRVSVPKTKNLLKAMSMRKRLCSKLFLTDQRKTKENKEKQRKTKENTCARSFSTRVKGLGGKSSPSGPRLRSLLENDNWEIFGWNFWRLSYNFIKLCCFKLFRNLFRRRWPRFKDGVPPGDGVANGDSGRMNNRNVSASKNCMIPWNIKFSFSPSRTFPLIYWKLELKKTFCYFSLHLCSWFVISVWMKK